MRISIKRKNINELLVCFILLAVALRGLLNNLYGIGTQIVDVLCISAFLSLFTWNRKYIKRNNNLLNLFYFSIPIVILIILIQVMADKCTLYRGYVAFRDLIIYAVLFPFTLLCLNQKQFEKIIEFFTTIGALLCVFGIVQFVFRASLPDYLMGLRFGISYTNYFRITALVGTTIDFGQFCILLGSVLFAEILTRYKNNILVWIKLVLTIIACLLTFGRIAMVGMAAVMVCEYYVEVRKKLTLKRFIASAVALVVIVIFLNWLVNSFIFFRFSSTNNFEITKNDGAHLRIIREAIDNISNNLLLGYSADIEMVAKNVIADGTFWTLILQFGVFIALFWWMLVIGVNRYSIKLYKTSNTFNRMLGLSFLFFSIEISFASILNSAWICRSIYIPYWMVAGMVLKLYYDYKNEAVYKNKIKCIRYVHESA